MSKKPEIIQKFLSENGIDTEIKEMPAVTHTAQEAADALGCELAQIGKSIIFKIGENPILFIVSGPNRVDTKKVEEYLIAQKKRLRNEFGELPENTIIKLEKADADFVYEKTGFPIGGVPPFAHSTKVKTYIDEDLFKFEEVWCAGGTNNTLFKIKLGDLVRLADAERIELK